MGPLLFPREPQGQKPVTTNKAQNCKDYPFTSPHLPSLSSPPATFRPPLPHPKFHQHAHHHFPLHSAVSPSRPLPPSPVRTCNITEAGAPPVPQLSLPPAAFSAGEVWERGLAFGHMPTGSVLVVSPCHVGGGGGEGVREMGQHQDLPRQKVWWASPCSEKMQRLVAESGKCATTSPRKWRGTVGHGDCVTMDGVKWIQNAQGTPTNLLRKHGLAVADLSMSTGPELQEVSIATLTFSLSLPVSYACSAAVEMALPQPALWLGPCRQPPPGSKCASELMQSPERPWKENPPTRWVWPRPAN